MGGEGVLKRSTVPLATQQIVFEITRSGIDISVLLYILCSDRFSSEIERHERPVRAVGIAGLLFFKSWWT
jgi:hypothetical protein